MQIFLDFGDGNGPVNYTQALISVSSGSSANRSLSLEPFAITRERSTYARCVGTLDAAAFALQDPSPGCHVQVKSNAGLLLFQGYVAEATHRAATRQSQWSPPVRFLALEDAFLNNAAPDTSLQPAASAVHAVQFGDNALRMETDATSEARADDVTVVGAEEPVTYVTELFLGDGTTALFGLTSTPFHPGGSQTLLQDEFAGTQFSTALWRFVDTGQHIGLGSGGLRLAGGNGFDGQTYMAAQQRVELGGTLCAEVNGVLLQPGSDGVLLGLYGNVVTRPNCFAGIHVNAMAGAQTLSAMVNGADAGTALAWSVGHSYTLRVRLHCAEMQRAMLSYQAVVNGTVQTWGGGLVDAPMQIVIEVIDEGLASSTPATVLYAGAVSSSIAVAIFAPVNSVSLVGSVQQCVLKQQGSLWVTTTKPDGTVVARRPGTLYTGEDYALNGTTIHFFPGREPVANERITAGYRRSQRAVARVQNADALQTMQEQGLPGLRQTVCHVTNAEPRSTADCATAAQALTAWYGSPAYGVSGTCSLPDASGQVSVQPGDKVALPLQYAAVNVPVVRVTITSEHAAPEVLRYDLRFAQRAENSLGFAVAQTVPADAVLPAAVYAAATTSALPQLTVTIAGTTALQVDAGTAAPVGGGFEVRRHDGGWGPDLVGAPPDSELVLRSPVRSFSVPRVAFAERFYVRMYDGSLPPVYSAQSSVVITHLPVG